MVKKLIAMVAALSALVLAPSVFAQKNAPGKMAPDAGKMNAMQKQVKSAMDASKSKGVTGTSKGTVKSAPAGGKFMLTTAKGDVTVDISKAKVRNGSGQFTSAASITKGAPAEVTGQWKGRTLVASSVTLTAMKSAPKPGGGKMGGGKMGGGKMGK